MAEFTLPTALADDVLRRLAYEPGGRCDLDLLYSRFCDTVPFDPVAKARAVREGHRPPGSDPVEVAEHFLATGLGGTCWATCGLLAALVHHVGVEATVGVERMRATDAVDFHSFVVAWTDDGPHMLDPVHASGRPLALRAGSTGTHPVYRSVLVGFDTDERSRRGEAAERPPASGARSGVPPRVGHEWASPDHAGSYVVLTDHLDPADVAAFCDVSVAHTGVRAQRLFHRTAGIDSLTIVRPLLDGRGLERRTWSGSAPTPERVELRTAEDICAALHVGEDGMAAVVASGLAEVDGTTWRFTV